MFCHVYSLFSIARAELPMTDAFYGAFVPCQLYVDILTATLLMLANEAFEKQSDHKDVTLMNRFNVFYDYVPTKLGGLLFC